MKRFNKCCGGSLLHFFNDISRHRRIKREDHHSLTSFLPSAKIHGCNIDIMLSHDCTDLSDHSGPVLISKKQHMFGGSKINLIIPHSDNPGRPLEKSPGNCPLLT